MGQEISITLSLKSAAALQQLNAFIAQTDTQLKDLQVKAGAASAGMAGGMKAAGDETMHLAGKVYYLRGSIDAIRFAAADGGARAGFYAIDEAVRGLVASGLGLGTIGLILAGMTAAVGVAYLSWREFGDGLAQAQEKADKLAETLDKLPALLKALQETGQGDLAQYLPGGGKQLYHGPNGRGVTDQPTAMEDQLIGGGGFVPARVVQVRVNLKPLTPAEAEAWAIHASGTMDSKGKVKAPSAALGEMQVLTKEYQTDSFTGEQKLIAAENDKFEKARAHLEQLHQIAKSAGDDNADSTYSVAFGALMAEHQAIIDDITTKAADKSAKAEAEREKKVDDDLTAFNNKLFAAQQKLAAQKKTDDDAQLARQKSATEELMRQQEIQQATARAKAEAALKEVQDNPFLTQSQKAQQSQSPIQDLMAQNNASIKSYGGIAANPANDEWARIQALSKINELTVQQVDLQYKLQAAQGENSFTYNLKQALVSLQNMNSLAREVAQTFEGVMNTAIKSVGSNLTQVIMGTKTWQKALLDIESTILTDIVNAIIEMGLRWVTTQIMMAVTGESLSLAQTAALIPIAAAQAAIWATPATLATIATAGVAAADAPGLMAIAESAAVLSAAPRASGGPVTAGMPYIVGEKRPELFIPSQNGHIIPSVPSLAGISSKSGSQGGGSTMNFDVHNWNDSAAMTEHIRRNPDVHHIILDKVKRNSHVISPA
jgi:hypothetical protein